MAAKDPIDELFDTLEEVSYVWEDLINMIIGYTTEQLNTGESNETDSV